MMNSMAISRRDICLPQRGKLHSVLFLALALRQTVPALNKNARSQNSHLVLLNKKVFSNLLIPLWGCRNV